jgi:membrane-associated protein
MDQILEFFHKLRDVKALVAWAGYVGLTTIIFAETGLLLGFFLPGDSLLVTAGLLSSQPRFGLNVYLLGALLTVASILGNAVGYFIGRASGPRLFRREESLLFKPRYLRQAHEFYERHGGKTIIIARFMPIVRTFVPVVAGAAGMSNKRYTLYNVVGGVLWIWSMLFTGYFLGRYIPGIDRHIETVIIVVIALSLLPGVIGWLRSRKSATVVDTGVSNH